MKKKLTLAELVLDDELLRLRPLDAHAISQYRQAMRVGAKFPDIIVTEDHRIVSGNHTYHAMLAEFGAEHEVTVDRRRFASRREELQCFAERNVKHGVRLHGHSKRAISAALIAEGATANDVAALMNVPVQRVESWGDMTVCVVGKGPQTIKLGPVAPAGKITQKAYEQHMEQDLGLKPKHLAEQLTRWLEGGWVPTDDDTIAAIEWLVASAKYWLVGIEIENE
jgi:hypothetical protein